MPIAERHHHQLFVGDLLPVGGDRIGRGGRGGGLRGGEQNEQGSDHGGDHARRRRGWQSPRLPIASPPARRRVPAMRSGGLVVEGARLESEYTAKDRKSTRLNSSH